MTQTADITSPNRRYVAELLYGRDMLGGMGSLSLFGRANIGATPTDQLPAIIGGVSGRSTRAGGADDLHPFRRSYSFRCKTEVVIAGGHVRAFSRSGNDCR